MITSVLSIPLFALILYGVIISVRYPHIRTMALRHLLSDKTTTLLTIVGLAISTALITLLLTVSDSLEKSSDNYLKNHYGPIYYEVNAVEQPSLENPYFSEGDLVKLRRSLDHPSSQALPIAAYTVTLKSHQGSSAEPEKMFPNTLVIGVDLMEVRGLRDSSLAANLPSSLPIDRAIMPKSVADQLQVEAGNPIRILNYAAQEQVFIVDRVVEDSGLVGYRGIQEAYGTIVISVEAARHLFGMAEQTYNSALILGVTPPVQWNYVDVKTSMSRILSDASSFISFLFRVTSLSALIMGIALMVNLFKLITEERKLESGILRSIGYSRVTLKQLFRLEGLFLGVSSGILGTVMGTGISILLTNTISSKFGLYPEIERVYYYSPDFAVMLSGCSIGLGIVYICIWIISSRAAKLSIIELRGSPFKRRNSRISVPAFSLYNWYALFVLIATVCLSVILVFPSIRREWFAAILFVMLLLISFASVRWLELAYSSFSLLFRRSPALFGMLNFIIKSITGQRSRSGMVILMFSTVSCFICVFMLMSNIMQAVTNESDHRPMIGGYDIYAYDYYSFDGHVATSTELAEYLGGIGQEEEVKPLTAAVVQLPWKTSMMIYGGIIHNLNGIDDSYAKSTTIRLQQYDARFATERDVWLEAARNPEVVIISSLTMSMLDEEYDIGDSVTFEVGGTRVSKRLIGISVGEVLWHSFTFGIWMNQTEVIELGKQDKRMNSALLIRYPTKQQAIEQLQQVEKALANHNISRVFTIHHSENEYYRTSGVLMNGFGNLNKLAMGIGISGLAVLLIHLSNQRRRQLGVLRAIGIPQKWLHFYLWAEGMILGLTGMAIGLSIGVTFIYMLMKSSLEQLSYQWPVFELFGIFGIFVAATWGTAAVAAKSVYRVPPAEATKHGERYS